MSHAPLPTLPAMLAYSTLGLALGLAYFRLLHWTLGLHLAGRRVAAALHLLRFTALAGALALVARAGAWPLLSAFAGLMIGRMIVVRPERCP